MKGSLKKAVTENPGRWIDVNKRCGVKLEDDGALVVSCRDTEEDPDAGRASAAAARRGLIFRFTGHGDGEDDQYVEHFAAGTWHWEG